MLPVIALVGRPNVGKSTLFNRLTGTRDALVADYPGLTRDRLYGFSQRSPVPAVIIDTGGIGGDQHGHLADLMERQVQLALDEADVIILLVDARDGLVADDQTAAELIRRTGKRVMLAVNKAESRDPMEVTAEFFELGLGDPVAISARRGDRVEPLLEAALTGFEEAVASDHEPAQGLRIAVVGRPNAGKSTLINRYLGEERLLASELAGTTRDSISVPFQRDGRPYVLVDTAGIRRKSRVKDTVEKFSIVQALKAMDEADAVILLVDARAGVGEQDVSLAGLVVERGRALVLGINKWDGLDPGRRRVIRDELDRRLPFLEFVDRHYVSALHGSGVGDLLSGATRAADAAFRELPTPDLTRVLEEAVQAHPPPVVRGRRIKLNYAHQGGRRPPVIVIHGNQTDRVPPAYRRYLMRRFRDAFRLHGTPIRLQFRTSRNPYAGRRNRLTPRQQRKRERMIARRRSKSQK